MEEIMYELTPLIEHVMAHRTIYAIGAPLLLAVVYFARPYSTAIIFHITETVIYMFAMHSVLHIVVRLFAWFSNESRFKAVQDIDPEGTVYWTTPWLHFWEWDVYDPEWLVWLEAAFVIIIIGLVRYYRPMKVQRNKLKSTVAPAKPKKPAAKKGQADDDDDDDWGVSKTRQYDVPDDFVQRDVKPDSTGRGR